jgi:hypothetical protein
LSETKSGASLTAQSRILLALNPGYLLEVSLATQGRQVLAQRRVTECRSCHCVFEVAEPLLVLDGLGPSQGLLRPWRNGLHVRSNCRAATSSSNAFRSSAVTLLNCVPSQVAAPPVRSVPTPLTAAMTGKDTTNKKIDTMANNTTTIPRQRIR